MRNPYEFPNEWEAGGEPTDESRFRCACGDPDCWCENTDATNLRIGQRWYAEECGRKQVALELSPLAVVMFTAYDWD